MFCDRRWIAGCAESPAARTAARLSARGIAALVFIALLSLAAGADAEMCSGEYQSGERRMSAKERALERARVREEQERTARLQRERDEAALAARRAEDERLAARPLGLRLVEQRCTTCHSPDQLARHRYGPIGWWAVLLRMEFLNGARFASGERRVIVAHLASAHAATALQASIEWGAAIIGVIGAGLALAWAVQRRRAATA